MAAVLTDVPVLLSDLELIRGLLNTLYNQHHAQDIVDQYRRLDNRNRRSPLTNAIAEGLTKVEGYVENAQQEDDDELPE